VHTYVELSEGAKVERLSLFAGNNFVSFRAAAKDSPEEAFALRPRSGRRPKTKPRGELRTEGTTSKRAKVSATLPIEQDESRRGQIGTRFGAPELKFFNARPILVLSGEFQTRKL
jgi:hypothetical protein